MSTSAVRAGVLVLLLALPFGASAQGPVAAYNFNEGSGSTLNDVSGNANHGTLSGASWTGSGKNGGALDFDGVNDRVNVPASASLNVTTGVTLEAWVYPTASQSGWRAVVQRENDAYLLHASNSAGALLPAAGGTFNGVHNPSMSGPSAIAVNTWTHLAMTYDGSTMRLYVDGAQVASRAESGTIETNSNPLSIGGTVVYGEFFQGRIDDLRVYNRALSAAEIQTDMATPVSGSSDTQAPTAPSSLSATTVSSTQINLNWTASTDNVGVTGYRVERCQGSSSCTNFLEVATPSGTSFSDTNLTPSTIYRYQVRATDAATNLSGYSNIASATTSAGPDTQAPTAPSNLSATTVSSTQINLSWTASTDNVGVTGYRVERCQGSSSCTNFLEVATPSGTSFSDTNLTPSTIYRYQVRATDAATNLSGYSNIATATTAAPPDTQAPSAPSGLSATAVSTTQINLSWTASTDNVGVTGYRVERCQGSSCTNFGQVGTPSGTTFNDSGLSASTTYRYQVRATDAATNLSGFSNIASATTQAPPDTQAPTTPGNLSATAASTTQINLSWTASTDNVGVTGYRVERCQGASCSNFGEIATTVGTNFNDTNLSPATTYRYQVRATDAATNLSGYSSIASATTQTPPDTQAPTAPGSLSASSPSSMRVNLSWTAATDNVGVTQYFIERCRGASCSDFGQIGATSSLTFQDYGTGLRTPDTYRFRMRARDAANNVGPYSSVASTVLSPSQEATTYSYDVHGRLTGVQTSGGVSENVSHTYQYDPAGNKTQSTTTGSSNPAP